MNSEEENNSNSTDSEGSEVMSQCSTELSKTKDVNIPLFCGDDYAEWRKAMKAYLRSMGSKVWSAVARKKTTNLTKEDYKNNSKAMKVITKGLTNEVKLKLGNHTSVRDLWTKLEETYKEKSHSTKEDTIEKEEKGSQGSLEISSEESNSINDFMIRLKAHEGISEDKESKEDDSLLFSKIFGPDELSDCSDYENEDSFKEKENHLIILKNKRAMTKHEDFAELKEDFKTAIIDTKKKIFTVPRSEFGVVEEKFINSLNELENVHEMNEILQELLMDSKESRRKIKKHSVRVKKKFETLKTKFLISLKRHLAAETIIANQKILLEEREKEIKNLYEYKTQQQNGFNEANKVMTEFSNLAKGIEILENNHKHLKVEVTNLKQMKIEKDHAILKEKEARYQRLVTLASGRGDATKEKSPIKKGEEDSVGLINNEMKRSYSAALKNIFTSGNKKEKVNYFSPEHISSSKRNKENGFENSSAIVDEIWAKQRPAHDRSGLGYIKDKRATHRTSTTKCEESISSSKDQYSSVKWNYENPFKSYSSHKYEPRTMKYDATRNLSRMIRCWRCKHVGHTTKFCHTIRCFKCKGFGHKAIDCRSTSSTSESTLKSFENESFPNTSKRKMKKVWRLKKIPSTDDGTKNSPEYQHPTNSKIEGDTHVISDEHSMVEENPNIDEDLEMALLLC